jgi:hypothetical protein
MRSSLTGFVPISLTMTRVFGLVSVLAALFAGVYLYAAQTRDAGPVTLRDERRGACGDDAAATNFRGSPHRSRRGSPRTGPTRCRPASRVWRRARPGRHEWLLPPDDRRPIVEHEVGPGGQPQAGPC